MKRRRILSLGLALALVSVLLTGCGASAPGVKNGVTMEMSMDEAAPMEAPAAGAPMGDAGSQAAAALPEARKWIVTVRLSAETEDLDAATTALQEKINSMEGYVEDQRVYNGSSNANRRFRSASMTVRIPAEQVDRFTDDVAGIANVVSRDKRLEDVTLRYVATEGRVKALETEEARLLELLAQAENMSDLLAIEGRLTDVRYELENTASQLRLLGNQIDYATVYLDIQEVREFTPVEDPTVWTRIRDGFAGSIKGLGSGIVDLLVWVLAASPYLVTAAAATAGVAVIVRKRRKAKKNKNTP